MSTPLAPRAQADSVTETTEYVLPQHANLFGNVFGGQIMAWVDLCAAIASQRHSGRLTVTATVDELHFQKPVRVGEVVRIRACVTATFNTSMELEVIVNGEDSRTREVWPCVRCLTTFVALGDDRKPTPVPPLLIDSEEVRESQAAGDARRLARLKNRAARSP